MSYIFGDDHIHDAGDFQVLLMAKFDEFIEANQGNLSVDEFVKFCRKLDCDFKEYYARAEAELIKSSKNRHERRYIKSTIERCRKTVSSMIGGAIITAERRSEWVSDDTIANFFAGIIGIEGTYEVRPCWQSSEP